MQDYSNEISLRFDRILTLDAIYKFKARAVRFYKNLTVFSLVDAIQ